MTKLKIVLDFTPVGDFRLMLSRNWSVDGSYRFVWLERVQSKDENLQNKKFQDEGHMVTIGLNYHFFKKNLTKKEVGKEKAKF